MNAPAPVRRVRPRSATIVGWSCLGLLVLLLVFTVLLGGELLSLRGDVARLRADASTAKAALSAPNLTAAAADREVRQLQADARSVRGSTRSAVWRLGSHVPLLGGPLRTVTAIAVAADDVTHHAVPVLAGLAVDVRTGTRTGPLDVTPVSRQRVALENAQARVGADQADLARQDLSEPALRPAYTEVTQRLAQLRDALTALTTVARVGPGMTGEFGDRTILLVLQTPAESRATGGLVGGFVELQVRHGAVRVVRSGTNHDLVGSRTKVPTDPGYAALWGPVNGQQLWYASNLSLDFPSVSTVWAGLYATQYGVRPDAVVGMTPEAVGRLLQVTGPLRLPGGEQLTSGNAAHALEVSLYQRFPTSKDEPARNAYQLAILHALSGAVLAPPPGGRNYLDALSGGSIAGALLLASTHAEEEQQLLPYALAGALPRDSRAFVAWSTQCAAGTKLDVYVHRDFRYDVAPAAGRQSVRATATVRNDAPTHGLPPYVTTRADLGPTERAVTGSEKLLVATYLSPGARVTSVTVGGRPAQFGSGTERGHPVVTVPVVIQPAGGTATVVVTADQPSLAGRVSTQRQPWSNEDRYTLP